jgi:hypothetical protein
MVHKPPVMTCDRFRQSLVRTEGAIPHEATAPDIPVLPVSSVTGPIAFLTCPVVKLPFS